LSTSELRRPSKDLDKAKADLDRFGYCLLAEALGPERLAAVRRRLAEQPLPVGSITRERFDEDAAGPPAMIAPPACCNIMWMLDDFTEENGATRVVPGSHLLGR
jgi:ectoine hydroxylase-related dioxygenase (phytanoyl-CoA dioxygenase family)